MRPENPAKLAVFDIHPVSGVGATLFCPFSSRHSTVGAVSDAAAPAEPNLEKPTLSRNREAAPGYLLIAPSAACAYGAISTTWRGRPREHARPLGSQRRASCGKVIQCNP